MVKWKHRKNRKLTNNLECPADLLSAITSEKLYYPKADYLEKVKAITSSLLRVQKSFMPFVI